MNLNDTDTEEKPSLRREEWNFSQVPKEELLGCCVWEFARESPTLRQFMIELYAYFLQSREETIFTDKQIPFQNWCSSYPEFTKTFYHLVQRRYGPLVWNQRLQELTGYPAKEQDIIDIPWQTLSDNHKQAYQYGYIVPLRMVSPQEVGTLVRRNLCVIDGENRNFIASIEWECSDREILDSLKQFLDDNRPDQYPSREKGRPERLITSAPLKAWA